MRGPHSSQGDESLPDFIRDAAKMRLYYYIGFRKQGKSTYGFLQLQPERMLAPPAPIYTIRTCEVC